MVTAELSPRVLRIDELGGFEFICFILSFHLARVSFLCLWIVSVTSLLIMIASATDCLERFISEMI